MTPTLTFTCSICGEPSGSICVYCTKDACSNHVCEKCGRCSDCCECEIRLDDHPEPRVHLHEAPPVEAVEAVEAVEENSAEAFVEIVVPDDLNVAPASEPVVIETPVQPDPREPEKES